MPSHPPISSLENKPSFEKIMKTEVAWLELQDFLKKGFERERELKIVS